MPRFPNEPQYGVQAGKPDFGGLAKGVWNVPYIVNLQVNAHDEKGCQYIEPPFKPAAKALWEQRELKDLEKDDPEGTAFLRGVSPGMFHTRPIRSQDLPGCPIASCSCSRRCARLACGLHVMVENFQIQTI